MKKIILGIIIAFHLSLQAQEIEIKSLKTYLTGDETSYPVLIFNQGMESTITIEFDIQSDVQPNLSIVFRFCDQDWNPYENIFLIKQGYNTAYNLWYDVLPPSVNKARYHFQATFPNFDVTFPFSGKWRYYITDSFDADKIFASGRFIVVYPEVELNTKVYNEKVQNSYNSQSTLDRVWNISTDFELPDNYSPIRVDHVEIIENQKTDYPILIKRETFGGPRSYEWNGAGRFTFSARDIKPGNEYRFVNLFDVNRFEPPSVNAHFDGVETSRYYIPGEPDLDGGSILTEFNDDYAEYMYVVFRLRPPENITNRIFLTGAFNNWQVLPGYELYNEDGLYKITVELKRGEYDYQYVTGDVVDNHVENIDWQILEGNFWETRNTYHIFLYYKEELLGGYDKIIGYKQIFTGDL